MTAPTEQEVEAMVARLICFPYPPEQEAAALLRRLWAALQKRDAELRAMQMLLVDAVAHESRALLKPECESVAPLRERVAALKEG